MDRTNCTCCSLGTPSPLFVMSRFEQEIQIQSKVTRMFHLKSAQRRLACFTSDNKYRSFKEYPKPSVHLKKCRSSCECDVGDDTELSFDSLQGCIRMSHKFSLSDPGKIVSASDRSPQRPFGSCGRECKLRAPMK